MQLNGNILIIGDSFCRNIEYWPKKFLQLLQVPFITQSQNKRVEIIGLPGAGWWPLRQIYLHQLGIEKNFLQNVELVIWIHPNSSRTFCLDESVYKNSPGPIDSNTFLAQEKLSISLYYKYIHNTLFNDWAQIQWFRELNGLLKSYPKVVHLFTNKHDFELSKELEGTKIKTSLLDIFMSQWSTEIDVSVMSNDGILGFQNHFKPENNDIFAEQLYEIVEGRTEDFDLTKFKIYE